MLLPAMWALLALSGGCMIWLIAASAGVTPATLKDGAPRVFQLSRLWPPALGASVSVATALTLAYSATQPPTGDLVIMWSVIAVAALIMSMTSAWLMMVVYKWGAGRRTSG